VVVVEKREMRAMANKHISIVICVSSRMTVVCSCRISLTPRFTEVLQAMCERKTVSTVFRVAEGHAQ
jgi:hypothetical protein